MRRLTRWEAIVLLVCALAGCQQEQAAAPAPAAPVPGPPKPGWEFTPEDFGIGHKSTKNDRCNRQIDVLREETRSCFNARPAPECEALQTKNAEKIGRYIRSPRCAK
jgi:hypothetical protein